MIRNHTHFLAKTTPTSRPDQLKIACYGPVYLALCYEMVPCKLGSSALGLTGEFSLLCAGTENTFDKYL